MPRSYAKLCYLKGSSHISLRAPGWWGSITGFYNYPHFTDGATEAQREAATCSSSHIQKQMCFHCSHAYLVSSVSWNCLYSWGIVYIHKNDTTNKNHRQEGTQLNCIRKRSSQISTNRADTGSNSLQADIFTEPLMRGSFRALELLLLQFQKDESNYSALQVTPSKAKRV